MSMATDQSFLGTGWSFPPTFRQRGRYLDLVSDEEDIQESLEILLSTRVGERVIQTRYGCNMDRLVFEPLDTALEAYMKDLIKTAILYFEPRIILEKVTLKTASNEGRIDVTITYTVATTNTRYNYVYPFYVNEGSAVT